VSLVGAGGMGEVYRARDVNLDRDVAIKVLPEPFAADPERIARFEREARVLGSLNHPNIAAIYGLERTSTATFLVMELVPGETVAARRARGRVPVDEALPMAIQIASALEAAHEKGIVHRDFKPANIVIAPDGRVKVLDFGLAKAFSGEAPATDVTHSPTMAAGGTIAGVLLGTAAYMSPEQARGKAIDKRADIWAFGCVLFEMLTGKPAFTGDSLTGIVAAVVTEEPDWSALALDIPPSIRSVLVRCLRKDLAQRLHDIADARIEMQEALAGFKPLLAPTTQPQRATRSMSALTWTLGVMLAAAIALLVMQQASRRVTSRAPSATRLELNLPPGVELYTGYGANAAVSPDGMRVAFIGSVGGVRQLYMRGLDQFGASEIRGTDFVTSFFFSPDGGAIGLLTGDRVLKKVSLADGLVVTIAHDVDISSGATWGADDRITFGRAGTLWQMPASGGLPQQLTTLDQGKHELLQAWPTAVAGGKAILFASVTGIGRDAAHIEALSSGRRHVVVDSATYPLYTPSGHLMFFRSGTLFAAPFDLDRFAIKGPPVRVVENLAVDTTGAPLVTVSASGSLVYSPSTTATSRLVWVTRQGVEQPITKTPRPYQNPRVARDGRRILVQVDGVLWILDDVRTTFTRLTSEETAGNSWPEWTTSGTRVVFRTRTGLRWIDADGGGLSQAIPGTSTADIPSSFSPDGETLALMRQSAGTSDIYVLSVRGDPHPRPLVSTPANEGGAQFSPDGHWMAYASDETGQLQVYVRPYPGPDRKWLVSTDGGTSVRWNSNGRELFYRNGDKMMVVDVSTSPELKLSAPRLLFEQRYAFAGSTTMANYDVSPDGQRFVMVKDDSGSGRLNIVLNWFEELKRLAPTK
jgi:hypothetical protein